MVVKRCSCGRRYDAAAWARLPALDRLYDDGIEVFELRNCACRSTIALEIIALPGGVECYVPEEMEP